MRLPRRAALALPALLAGGADGTVGQAAGGAGPVTLLVGGSPGSRADIWARSFAPFLERHWPRISAGVVNRPGQGGLAAARMVATAPREARLIGAITTPLLLARAVEARDTALLGRLIFAGAVAEEPLVLVAHPGSAGDLAMLRRLGPQATLGTPPPGSAAQLAALAFSAAVPLVSYGPVHGAGPSGPLPTRPLNLLAFPNAAAARQAVLAGNIPYALLPLPEAIAGLRDGRLAGLAMAQEQRSALLPEVPTFTEQGIPLLLAAHRGFILPVGAEPRLLQPLTQALRSAATDPEFAAQAEAGGYIPRFMGQAAWEPMLRRVTAELARRWITDPWTGRQD